jgi:hypothetical protein
MSLPDGIEIGERLFRDGFQSGFSRCFQFLNVIARSNEHVVGFRKVRFVAERPHLGESCRTPRLNPISGRGHGIAEAL